MTLEHLGPTFVEDVEVTDELPEGVTFVCAGATRGSYDESDGLWEVGTLDADGIEGPAEATLEIRVSVADGTSGETIENLAEITNASRDDPNLANNQHSASVTVPGCPLSQSCECRLQTLLKRLPAKHNLVASSDSQSAPAWPGALRQSVEFVLSGVGPLSA